MPNFNKTLTHTALASLLLFLAVGCGPAFQTELTVDLDPFLDDPIYDIEPPNANRRLKAWPGGSTNSFRIMSIWEDGAPEDFLYLVSESTNHGVQFLSVECLGTLEKPTFLLARGKKHVAGYGLGVRVLLTSSKELRIELTGANDLEPSPPTIAIAPSELPPLVNKNDSCDPESLADLETATGR